MLSPLLQPGIPSRPRRRQLLRPAAAAGPRRLKQLGSRAQRRDALFRPLEDGAEPLGTLVVRVHAGRDLVAKDKNGLSDPYLVIRFGPHRITSPVVPKTLNPVWGAGGETGSLEGVGGEAKLELKLFDCLALGYERVEIVCYDKDRLGSEYMGELSLGLEDWWGSDAKKWKDEKPPVGFHDSENEPIWHTLRSSRSRSSVSGQLLVQIGFLPAATTSSRKLSDKDRERIFGALGRVASELEGARRASREERVFLVPPTDGLGTQPADEASPLGNVIDDPDSESSDSDADTASISTDGGDSDTEDASTTGDEEVPLAHEQGYFDLPTDAQLEKSTSPENAITESPAPIPDIRVEEQAHASSSSSSSANVPIPPPTPSRRGLSLPGFVKRRFSSQNILSTASQPTTPGAESDFASTTDIDSAATASSSIAADTKKRRRFPRRRKTADSDAGIADGLVEMSLVAGGIGFSPAAAPGKRKGRRRTTKAEDGATDGKRRRSRRSRKKHHGAFTLAPNDGIAGLVQIEITGAKDLPRFKNAFRTSYDMDPFVVIAFGHKIFRTRVIRHSLNPVWEERLYFHVGEAETHWTIAFTVSDWDKISGNDHVGDVAVPLEQLLGTSIQHDDRGIYPAGPDGKLVGDDFHVHELPLILSDKDAQGVNPKLIIRAKYTPYAALRQSLWRVYAAQYDLDGTGELSYVELFSMLDSLGSTLTKKTIELFFTRFGKTLDDELSMEEVVLCLEDEVQKPNAERRHVSENSDTGANTPAGPGAGFASGFAMPEHYQPDELQQADQSSDMKTIPPGTEIVTDTEKGKVITAPEPKGTVKPPSSPTGAESAEPSSADEGDIERVVNIKECPLCRKPRLNAKAEVDIITHLGVCASTDPSKVNRVLVTNFVTASQAQRKFLNKVFAKVTKGQYALGADSANIIVQDRQTGTLQEEKMAVYVRLGIRLMYKGMSGNMEGSRIRRMLDSLTKKQGLKYDSPASAREIEPFIRFHNLNMNEVLDPLSSFKTFNEFFYRKLKPDARPVADPEDPRTVVSCADCRAMFFQTVDDATSIWIKGREFTVGRMLGDYYKDKASEYDGGSLAIFRLAPQDYHRYHSPVDGVMGHHDYIAGQYYTVNPMAIRSNVSVYSENVRLVASIDSPIFGEVMNVWVGAMMVASIHMTKQEGEPVKRGEETGYFAFGGSTIVVLFKPNTVQFDADLLNNSKNSIETLIRPFVRWDTVYFVNIALEGYTQEQRAAFMPGLPGLMRAGGEGIRWLRGGKGAASGDDVVLAGMTATAAAAIAAAVVLHRLTVRLFPRRSAFALTTALLFLLAPGRPTLHAVPYTEPFAALFTFLGMLLFYKNRDATAAVAWALGTTMRAQGVVLGLGFFGWKWVLRRTWDGTSSGRLQRLATGIPVFAALSLLSSLPFLAFQRYVYTLFCSEPSSLRPWCTEGLGFSYGWIQSEYWDVGLFRYWTLLQLPNFLLAAPVLALSLAASYSFYRSNLAFTLRSTLPFLPLSLAPSAPPRHANPSEPLSNPSSPSATLALIPLIHLHTLLTLLLLTTAHVQIVLRVCVTNPVVWWYAAELVCSGSRWGRRWVVYCVVWGTVATGLWAVFLPPA
ncbi:hypothetical protein NBRC10513_006125 [Rhodotorula toruloides]